MLKNKDFSLNRQTLPEQVAEKLETMILMDVPEFAGKLSSEQALSATFAVSRTVIREALVILRAKGLVAKSNGSCSKVVCNPAGCLEDTLQQVIRLRNIQPFEIYEVRIALESLGVHLAAEKKTAADIAQLRKMVDEINSVKDDLVRRAELDLNFHMKIIEIGQNPLLVLLAGALFVMLKPIICKALERVGTDASATRQQHASLVDALERGDSDKAHCIVQTHLALSMRNFELYLKSEKKKTVKNADPQK